jgi:hypothetical protein
MRLDLDSGVFSGQETTFTQTEFNPAANRRRCRDAKKFRQSTKGF